MPEGPSLVIAQKAMIDFKGKIVKQINGYGADDVKHLAGKKLTDIKTWGKHLLLCFGKKTIRVHLMLFGKYRVNSSAKVNAKLHLGFANNQEINFYVADIKFFDEPLDEIYDWSTDVMSKKFDPKVVKAKLKKIGDTLITDALMDQHIFTGVGNIIKNEVMWRVRVHPKNKIENIPARKLSALIKDCTTYSYEFLEQRQAGTLSKNWKAYKQEVCERCNSKLKHEIVGKTKRQTFYCNNCQERY